MSIEAIQQSYEQLQMSQREYAEETVFWTLKSATQFSARRRTTTLFLANATGNTPDSYTWIDNTPGVWDELKEMLEAQDPATIALNIEQDIAFSSGMHAGEFQALYAGVGPKWARRFITQPMLAVEYIATQPAARMSWYPRLMETAWAMIDEAFSERVITPGKTTVSDVEWWLRERIQEYNYTTWFQPDVTIIDEYFEIPGSNPGFPNGPREVIEYGDMLHVDFGVTALGLNTDTQHLGYVLRPGETEDDIPQGLKDGLKKGNRMQDIVKSNMKVGSTGNDILAACLAQMSEERIDGLVYSHPIGDWGHSAGTLVGERCPNVHFSRRR